MNYKIEICSNSVQSAVNAQTAGADRVELCDNLWESGTTPGPGSLKLARERLSIEIFVLVRPRGGDFLYSDLEFDIIKEDIKSAKLFGMDGIVCGVLNQDSTVDLERTKELIDLSHPLPFTFHRAFDVIIDKEQALEDIISCGATRVLTSGGFSSAPEGKEIIKSLNQQAGGRIMIMPGGGIDETNISDLLTTGCREFHLTGMDQVTSTVENGHTLQLNGSKDIPENDYMVSSVDKIRKILDQINN